MADFTPYHILVVKEFKPDFYFKIGETTFAGHYAMFSKYEYFEKMEDFNRLTHKELPIIDISIDKLFGIDLKYTYTAKRALNEILMQIYNGPTENASPLNIQSKSPFDVKLIVLKLILSHYFMLESFTKIYVQKLSATFMFKNLLYVAKECDVQVYDGKTTGSFLVPIGKDVMTYSPGDYGHGSISRKITIAYLLTNCFNFILKPTIPNISDISLNYLNSGTSDADREKCFKQITPIRANHESLFCLTSQMYDKIISIFEEHDGIFLKDDIPYKTFYKMFVIPTKKTTNFNDPDEALNYANYLALTRC